MQYVRFVNTGLRVSKICLGCMSYGTSAWSPWIKNKSGSIKAVSEAYEAANGYSNGYSEIVLGKALKAVGTPRGRVVVANKVYMPVYSDPNTFTGLGNLDQNPDIVNQYGLSRKHIFDAVDASLERLGLDYIDL